MAHPRPPYGAFSPAAPTDGAEGPQRPLEVMLGALAAFLLSVICVVVGAMVLFLVWAIWRLGLVGFDRSWLAPSIVFALVGAVIVGLGVALGQAGRGLFRGEAAWRRRAFWLFGGAAVAIAPAVLAILGTYLGGGPEFVMVAMVALIVALVGALSLSTRAARAWFARETSAGRAHPVMG